MGLRASLLSADHVDSQVLSGEFEGESPYLPIEGHQKAFPEEIDETFTEAALSLLTDEQKAFLEQRHSQSDSGDDDDNAAPSSVNEV